MFEDDFFDDSFFAVAETLFSGDTAPASVGLRVPPFVPSSEVATVAVPAPSGFGTAAAAPLGAFSMAAAPIAVELEA